MNKKFIILAGLISLSITLCLMSNTYSRYVADTTGSLDVSFSKWQILVNDTDITSSKETSINVEPVMEENVNVKKGTIAPSSKGYFDIDIDPSNAELSFNYEISLSMLNENMPDIMITKYSIIDKEYDEKDTLPVNNITENKIVGSLNYDSTDDNFKFEPLTIRIYFEWYEGENEKMDDEADTLIGVNAENEKLQMQVDMKFEQKLSL